MVCNRTRYWIENVNIINNWQAGFQPGMGCEDQIIRLSQSIQDAFEKRDNTASNNALFKGIRPCMEGKLINKMDVEAPTAIVMWTKSKSLG